MYNHRCPDLCMLDYCNVLVGVNLNEWHDRCSGLARPKMMPGPVLKHVLHSNVSPHGSFEMTFTQ